MTAHETALFIQEILADKKAQEIKIMDLTDKSILTDRFVIATGRSVTHIKSLAGDVEKELKDKYRRLPSHIEGIKGGRWVLMDYGDVIVHIFHSEEREFYNLEKLWRAIKK